ncbi:HAD family phosphatase [uncultured Eubacterium sp.]|uniref:HAD family hydrolase n=1 Tax=uncultured Eubacterium sp. TaxID=165185 RepID=UPI002598A4BF|nr:HAD family phosphatase [uncultured Eubacterium sp.]
MNRENWLKNIEGAVFDLDGTLLDSSWVWEKVDKKFLGDRGFQVPDDYVDEISPLGAERAAVYTIERFGLNEDKDDIVREWIEMAKKEYATEVVCKPYAKEFLEELHKLNIKMAVATSSDRELFMKTLEREGILKYFQKIVTVDEVERGKGYPDIYEEAARRIKVNPHKCLVFEDILAGVTGASLGEFNVVAVFDEKSKHNWEKIKSISKYSINDYKELL